jgi:hypothetical protein
MPLAVINRVGPVCCTLLFSFQGSFVDRAKSAIVRPDVRDELFILNGCRCTVNSFFCVPQSALRALFGRRQNYNVVEHLSTTFFAFRRAVLQGPAGRAPYCACAASSTTLSCLQPSFLPPRYSCPARSSGSVGRGSKKAANYWIGCFLSTDNSGACGNICL